MTFTPTLVQAGVAEVADEAVTFLRELVRTPSVSGSEQRVIALIGERMRDVGFDEVRVDPFGNVWGRVGNGKRTIAFDAHVDTVDVGDPALWQVDPFGGELIDGVVHGRGAADQKAGMAALVYAGALLHKLGVPDDITVWMIGSVLEEDCDGLCWHYILSEKLMQPELVVLTEPTNLQVYRGHRGRMEMDVTLGGLACHGSAPARGVNAIHRMAPVLAAVDHLGDRLAADPFLGKGSVTTSEIRSGAPSLCAVADRCTIHLDRRLSFGETDASATAEIAAIVAREAPRPEGTTIGPDAVVVPEFQRPSYTGLIYPMRQYFPAWVLPEEHPAVRLALAARAASLGEAGTCGKWDFSTNGVATRGLHGIPTIGFGPACEIHAHAPTDQCPADHVPQAIAFYTTFVGLLKDGLPEPTDPES